MAIHQKEVIFQQFIMHKSVSYILIHMVFKMVGFFSFLLSKNGGKIYTQKFIILAISECTVEWHEVRSHCGTALPMVQALCM